MKYLKHLAVAATVASVAVFGAAAPASSSEPAVENTTVAFYGSLNIAPHLSYGTTLGMGGQGPCATAGVGATTAPENGGLCNVGTTGSVQGSCALWTASVSGSISPTIATGSAGLTYDVNLGIWNTGGVLTITGTARNPAGEVKQVVGGGVLANETVGGSCQAWDGATVYTMAASLTLI